MSTDYFPPIQRAVQGLSPNNQDTRAALYEKARKALMRQLHAADPALTHSQISRERNLLEDAILRIEQSYDEPAPEPEGPVFQAPPAPRPAPADQPADAPAAGGKARDRLGPAAADRRPEQRRPQAPRRAPSNNNARRYAVMAVVAALIVGGGAATALYLRGAGAGDGESSQAVTAPATTPAAPAPADPAKLDDRVGSGSNAAPQQAAPDHGAEPEAPTRSIAPQPSKPAQAPAPAAPAPLLPSTQGETSENQRARMVEEDPLAPMRNRVFDGTVNWRTESQASGSNAPLETVIIGDLNIPDRKLRAVLTLRRNSDPAFPAAFLLQVQMTVPQDYPNGNVAALKGISVKPAPQQAGIPLDGALMKVTTGVFLMGIADPFNEKGRNAKMLQNNSWFQLEFAFDNGRNAILTFEKGATGTKVFDDAMAAWNNGTAARP
ncbi:hypothetical protein [Labrys monachus]|uniref:Uncharacterized protein n=1 Tax=Labrys monachus TaxID=217067 RepID=A0ABU0F874_9HYPH|nr:hypothetical protein [Labrys monachus]MDQ0390818.1 hypothetical protein [Labrys monachus]